MPKAKSHNPEIEIKANFGDSEEWKKWMKDCKNKPSSNAYHGSAGALYFVGFIGSLVYWWQAANGFGAVVTGLLKSMVWPAYIVYHLLVMFYGVVH